MTSVIKVDTIQNSSGTSTLSVPATTGTIATTNGITVYESWSRSDGYDTVTTTGQYFTTNWNRYGDSINAGVTESSGVFSFPSTGLWIVKTVLCGFMNAGENDSVYMVTQVTTDNSNYTAKATARQGAHSTLWYQGATEELVDVTDTSNVKVKFQFGRETGTQEVYFTSGRYTKVVFMKIGDT